MEAAFFGVWFYASYLTDFMEMGETEQKEDM